MRVYVALLRLRAHIGDLLRCIRLLRPETGNSWWWAAAIADLRFRETRGGDQP